MNILESHIGKDIMTIICGYFDNNEWYYLNNTWELIKEPMNYAAINGYLDLMKWGRANDYSWDSSTCKNTAENGHLSVLQWAQIPKIAKFAT